MKKNIFIILITILFILILLYFYDKREEVLNKEYLDTKNNIHIEYPFFNQSAIDKYLNDYLNHYIENEKRLENLLFIDYDLLELEESNFQLMMYVYEEEDNVVRENQKTFLINVITGEIMEQDYVTNASLDYDIYQQKLIDKKKPMVALTFDDGPNHNTTKILNILEQYGIKATFFILGTNIEGNKKIIKKMKLLEMEIGNHMYSHKLLTKLKNEEIIKEIEKVDQLIYNITREYPTLIRPSYGTYNKRILSIIDRPIITWNIDTLDWKYHNSKKIYQRVMKNISDGDIILMHDIYNATANSLNFIIPKLLEMNYQFVTVSELLYYKGISTSEGKVYSNAN